MERVEYKDIPITELLLDVTNPRNPAVESQRDEIDMMLEGQGAAELIKLGRSLAEEQNPLANVGAFLDKVSGKYIVVEGNRRLTALKLLINPDLASRPGAKKAFQELQNEVGLDNIPHSLHCAVFPTREAATKWILLTHTGENDGVGTKRWGTNEQARFLYHTGQKPGRVFMVMEYLRLNPYFEWTEASWKIGIRNPTTLARLLDDNVIFSMLRLKEGPDWTISSADDEWSAKLLHELVERVDSSKLQARMINTRSDAKKYVEELIAQLFPESRETSLPPDESESQNSSSQNDSNGVHDGMYYKPWSDSGADGNSVDNTLGDDELTMHDDAYGHPTPSVPPLERRTKFVKGRVGKLTGVTGSKASQIYKEFSKIDCASMPVAAGFLLRAMIEETGKRFHDSGMIKAQLSKQKRSNLSVLMNSCIDYVKSAGNDKQKKDSDRIVVTKDEKRIEINQLEILNNGIHGMDIINPKETLFPIWDQFQPFIQDLWDMINEHAKKDGKSRK